MLKQSHAIARRRSCSEVCRHQSICNACEVPLLPEVRIAPSARATFPTQMREVPRDPRATALSGRLAGERVGAIVLAMRSAKCRLIGASVAHRSIDEVIVDTGWCRWRAARPSRARPVSPSFANDVEYAMRSRKTERICDPSPASSSVAVLPARPVGGRAVNR